MEAVNLNEPANIATYLRTPGRVRADAEWCGISREYSAQIQAAAEEMIGRAGRLEDLARCAASLFDGTWNGSDWQDTPRDDSASERFFLLFPLLQHLPVLQEWYAERGIPERILADTLTDLQIWIDTKAQRTGMPGFKEVGWLRLHFSGQVIRLGRLQFQPSKYSFPFTPLVNKTTGEVRIAAHGGRAITAKGVFSDSEGAEGKTIELEFVEYKGEITKAHVVNEDGYIGTKPVTFESGTWEKALREGDPVLALHIPAGEPLDYEACMESYRMAADFFPRHFCDTPPPLAITCSSWLFYPGLCDILPEDSNIVRFQRTFHRLPLPGAKANQTYERVFTPYGRTITENQLKNTLQRNLFKHIRAGNTPITGGGLLLPIGQSAARRVEPTTTGDYSCRLQLAPSFRFIFGS